MTASPATTLPATITKDKHMKKRSIAAALAAVAIAVTIPFAYAQMGGYGVGPGMMGGYGQGQGGYGPGMMGGYGGGYGMGPGMMGGYGGGYGMGPGMMGGYGPDFAGALNLSDEQREKITKIQEGVSTKHWELMGKMREQQFKLRELLASGKADDAAVGKAYKHLEELRQQMWTTALDAQKQVEASLTKSQREQLQRGWGRDTK